MLGSNYYGQAYYGQGPAVGTTFVLKTVTATTASTGAISFVLLISKTLTATVTSTASIRRMFMRTLTAVVTASDDTLTRIIEALNIRKASTKILTLYNATRSLDGTKTVKCLNESYTTKDTTREN